MPGVLAAGGLCRCAGCQGAKRRAACGGKGSGAGGEPRLPAHCSSSTEGLQGGRRCEGRGG
eukprot:scaffold1578_cov92-Isochrysis_galbana.AAC.1